MDDVGRAIVWMLLRDGGLSQRNMARILGLSPVAVNYRIRRMMSGGVLRGFYLYVDPNFYGLWKAYVVFRAGSSYEEPAVVLRFSCLEQVDIYQVVGRSIGELKETIMEMRSRLGEPLMVCIPSQCPLRPSMFDSELVRELRGRPRMSASRIAESLGIPPRTVTRHLRHLRRSGLVRIIPMVDLAKAGITMFSLFSGRMNLVRRSTTNCSVWEFITNDGGGVVCVSRDLGEAKAIIDRSRALDPDVGVMVIYDYEIRDPASLS
jgi:DNA-binding Lrp family transcriptional regulator